MKKISSIILAAIMLIGVSCSVFANEAVETMPTLNDKIAVLKEYKIFEGDENGNLNLDKEITRAEFCKVICSVLHFEPIGTPDVENTAFNEETNMQELTGYGIFTDVPKTHWAYYYMKTASDAGLINGVGNGRFCPEDPILEVDAIKIITAALGYTPQAADLGGYPDGFLKTAEGFGITTDTPDKAILREKVAEYLYTALDVPLMVATGYNAETQKTTYAAADEKSGIEMQTWRIALDKKLEK